MANLYDYIGARPSASPDELRKAIDATRTRLKMTGQIYQGTNEERLREAEQILLNPLERIEYDKKMGIKRYAQVQRSRFKPSRRRVNQMAVLLGLLLLLAAVLLYSFRNSFREWPTGTYLARKGTGQQVAVLVGSTTTYAFPDKTIGPAWAVKDLQTGVVRWVSRSQLFAEFDALGPAPEKEWRNVPLPPAVFSPQGK